MSPALWPKTFVNGMTWINIWVGLDGVQNIFVLKGVIAA